ncbi:MAG TPA: hypothetical protein VHY91_21805 [Pirellulales bacterium]|jgi:hypothetical protein|nr:hypothetical protein [Pirellulales bacterium]
MDKVLYAALVAFVFKVLFDLRQQWQRARLAEAKILVRALRDFNDDTDLLEVIKQLRNERSKSIPPTLEPMDLRNLPAFFDRLAVYWTLGIVSTRKINEVFGDDIELCARSTKMWVGESPEDHQAFWGLFLRLRDAVMARRDRHWAPKVP